MYVDFVIIVCALSNPNLCETKRIPLWQEVTTVNQCILVGPKLSEKIQRDLKGKKIISDWKCEKSDGPIDLS
jgi:hypothetical protein